MNSVTKNFFPQEERKDVPKRERKKKCLGFTTLIRRPGTFLSLAKDHSFASFQSVYARSFCVREREREREREKEQF